MHKTSKIVLSALGIVAVAVASGLIGAYLRPAPDVLTADTTTGSFIQKIRDRGELRVGVAIAPPMTIQETDGTLTGPNLIPLRHLAHALNIPLTPVAAEWNNIVSGLQAGRYDVAANLDRTIARSLAIQFTDAVYEYQGVFVVKADSPYNTAAEIITSGSPIATAQGGAPETALKGSGGTIFSMDTYPNAVSTVRDGRTAAEFADLATAQSQAKADENLKIIVPDPLIYLASDGYGVPDTIDPRSMQILNIAIETAKNSGELDRAYHEAGYLEINNLGSLRKGS
jgi:ABC-type amino acid transport substrate-binding protein